MSNPPKVTSDENSCAEFVYPRTISDVPISNRYLTKIAAEIATRERPDFIAPTNTYEVQKALVGKPLESLAGGEGSGRKIVILSERLQYLVTSRWG